MNKDYRPAAIERGHYERWEGAGYFAPSGRGKPYCIVIPPPNVTGTLHMGHAFGHTVKDILIRYHRMQGDDTLWQPGTDHAGIATQIVVQNLLEAEGTTREKLGRERFVERVWEWKRRSGDTIARSYAMIFAPCSCASRTYAEAAWLSVGWITRTFAPCVSTSSTCAICFALSLSAASVTTRRSSSFARASKYFRSFW